MGIIVAFFMYVFFILLVTLAVDRGYYKSSERYWYFFKVWYLVHLIPDFFALYEHYFNGVKLSYDYGVINLIKIAPFWLAGISLFFSDLKALLNYNAGRPNGKHSLW